MLSFFPRDILDAILNLIGSVSEGFPSCSKMQIYEESNDAKAISVFLRSDD